MAANSNFYGTGRRKKSIARVFLVPGKGEITVDKRSLDDYFGLGRGTVSAWENGWREPEEELLEDIARYFRVKIQELTGEA